MTRQSPDTRQPSGHGDGDAVLHIGYVLCYRDPHYIRSLSLLRALEACPNVKVVVARNTSRGLWRYIETWRALRRAHATHAPDIYILGFRGHEIFLPVSWMIRGVPLIVDALMSPYAALREERKAGLFGKIVAPLVYWFERSILQRADLVLTDTRLHVDFYARTFALSQAKVCALPVGAIEPEHNKEVQAASDTSSFSVLFYGSFLPLHGIEVILEAAALLKNLPIRFDFIGGGLKQTKHFYRRCRQLNLTNYTHRQWVPFEQILQDEIPQADLCLGGPFGGTPQARRVITGKTSQCLALGKATVIGRIDEDYGFADRINCLLVEQADAHALATVLRWAYENRKQLVEIGAYGHALYDARLSTRVIADRLLPALRHVAARPLASGKP